MGPTVKLVTVDSILERDIDQIRAIDAAVYPRPWSKRLWLQELVKDDRVYRCARDGRQVIGVAGAMLVGEDAHIMTVAVDPDVQRTGVASRLLLALIREIVIRGTTRLSLEVRVSNTGAQALYRHFGFAPVGSRRKYYEPEGEDALVMWVDDIQDADYRSRLDEISAQIGALA